MRPAPSSPPPRKVPPPPPAARGGRGFRASAPPAAGATSPKKTAPPADRAAEAPLRRQRTPPGPPPPAGAAPSPAARKEPRKRYGRHDLAGTDSPYLCPSCHDPLYVDMATMKEVCFNRKCACYANRGEIAGNLAEHDGPRRARKLCAESAREFRKFNRRFLLRKIHEARAAECAKFIRGDGMNIAILVSLDHLLTRLQGNTEWGGSRDRRACRAAFDDYYEKFEMLQFAEDICSKHYVTNVQAQPFVIKYYQAIRNSHRASGMADVGDGRPARAGPLPFSNTGRTPAQGQAKRVFDLGALLKNSPQIGRALNRAFRMRHPTSKMYGHPAKPGDVAALLALWKACPPGRAVAIGAGTLREIYEGAAGESGHFGQFLEDYASGRAYAPILVFDGEKYRFDHATLLLYLVYLLSDGRPPPAAQDKASQAARERTRRDMARSFEAKIRQKLRADGFDVRPREDETAFSPSFDGRRREFDCVAVDRKRRIIVLVEAKCEGIAPSSMARDNRVEQLVLDMKTGLLAHAKRHWTRREFFRMHFDGMGQRGLDLDGHFSDYTVHTLLVTRQEPLISRHMGVDILPYEKFTSIDFRSTTARDDLDGTGPEPAGRPTGAAATGGPARPAREGGGGAGSPRRPGRGRRG